MLNEERTTKRNLIFIPYQDLDNFYSEGILTREFSILFLLQKMGFSNIINVKKPRTIIDTVRYHDCENYFPEGSIEALVKGYCDNSKVIQYHPVVSLKQLLTKRCWWKKGYLNLTKQISDCIIAGETLVYSNNPFASELLYELRHRGAIVYFDAMDNFAIHPSLNSIEKKSALNGYSQIVKFANIISANSIQTCEFLEKIGGQHVILLKNGVFTNDYNNMLNTDIENDIRTKKRGYKKCVGYIGKIGKRIDSRLIEIVSKSCKDTLFIFIGKHLKDQYNRKLELLFKNQENIVHMEAIPSAYIYSALREFDKLMIPHSVGAAENGGDPLKLYQYLVTGKPIITTDILGVSDYKELITISNSADEWIDFVNKESFDVPQMKTDYSWDCRFIPIRDEIFNYWTRNGTL